MAKETLKQSELPTTASSAQPRSRYKVALVCPTPLLHKELVVEADTEDQARSEFCKANGISGSIHPWTITRVSDGQRR